MRRLELSELSRWCACGSDDAIAPRDGVLRECEAKAGCGSCDCERKCL